MTKWHVAFMGEGERVSEESWRMHRAAARLQGENPWGRAPAVWTTLLDVGVDVNDDFQLWDELEDFDDRIPRRPTLRPLYREFDDECAIDTLIAEYLEDAAVVEVAQSAAPTNGHRMRTRAEIDAALDAIADEAEGEEPEERVIVRAEFGTGKRGRDRAKRKPNRKRCHGCGQLIDPEDATLYEHWHDDCVLRVWEQAGDTVDPDEYDRQQWIEAQPESAPNDIPEQLTRMWANG